MRPDPVNAPDADLPPVSCYIRTLNEERRIGDVVTAALRAVREVVIIDSGSTDATVSLAEAAGARVIANPWPGNGHQKRVGEEACHNDWLLDLDADEVVDPDLADAIKTLFRTGAPERSVYAVRMITKPPGHPAWLNFAHTYRNKLYDRRKWRIPAHPAWDQLELPRTERPPRLDGAIIHYSFKDIAHLSRKMNSVSSVRAANTPRRGLGQLRLRIFGGLPIYFLKHYVLRGYFRGGTYGFAVAMALAHARWLRDVKMYEQIVFERAEG